MGDSKPQTSPVSDAEPDVTEHAPPTESADEFYEDGRLDRTALRLAWIVASPSANRTESQSAFLRLQEIAELREGRVARRFLARQYRAQQHDSGVDQIHNLGLRLGTPTERVHILVERYVYHLDEGADPHDLIALSLAGVDRRRITDADIAYALVRTWFTREHLASAPQLLDIAGQYYERLGEYHAALIARILTLREYAPRPEFRARSAELAHQVIESLEEHADNRTLAQVRELIDVPELARYAYELASSRSTTLNIPRDQVLQAAGRLARPTVLASATPHTTPVPVLTTAEAFDDPLLDSFPISNTADIPFTAESTQPQPPLTSAENPPFPLSDKELQAARQEARDDTSNLSARERLVGHYRHTQDAGRELVYLSELADLITAKDTRAEYFRRCSELLLSLGDIPDALRVRLEAMVLSTPQEHDADFILEHCPSDLRPDLIEIIQRFLPHVDATEAARFAYIGARLLLQEPSHPNTAWDILLPAWVASPHETAPLECLLEIGPSIGRCDELHSAVFQLAGQGKLSDPAVIGRLTRAVENSTYTECYILLHICATAVSPLNDEPRRALEVALLNEGRSRASAFRQVHGMLSNFKARRYWTDRTATALETERRFSEAAELLLAHYTFDSEDPEIFWRALLNLERDRQYVRVMNLLEAESIRPRNQHAHLRQLRHLSRISRVYGDNLETSRKLAMEAALAHVHDPDFDAHARAELADGNADALATYLERRGHRLGYTREAGDLFLEAADILLKARITHDERYQRLLFAAHRSGTPIEPIRRRLQQLAMNEVLADVTAPTADVDALNTPDARAQDSTPEYFVDEPTFPSKP